MSRGRFSDVAGGYRATMVPSMLEVVDRVIARATLRPGERVLDLGTGTGIAAAAACGEGREVTGVDAAPGMLAIARSEVPGVAFREMDFMALELPDAAFDCLVSVHALLFADDRGAALREWRRVTRPGGRVSLSVPGPEQVTPHALYGELWERHGVGIGRRYATPHQLAALAGAAGWAGVETEVDPEHVIRLPDDDAFRVWCAIGSRGEATAAWSEQQLVDLTEAMLAITPRDSSGALLIPFGVIYLSATAGG